MTLQCALNASSDNCLILADEVAHELEKPGQECYNELTALLGRGILAPDGTIDRQRMAAEIFADRAVLDQVNEIVHPAVKAFIIQKIRAEKESAEYDFLFVEAALLIEGGYEEILRISFSPGPYRMAPVINHLLLYTILHHTRSYPYADRFPKRRPVMRRSAFLPTVSALPDLLPFHMSRSEVHHAPAVSAGNAALAHMSDDKQLIEAYQMEQDIHRITASKVFHTPFDEVFFLFICLNQKFIMHLQYQPGTQPFLLQSCPYVYHRQFNNIGGRTLDRGVHGHPFSKRTLHEICGRQFRDRTSSAKHRLYTGCL